MDLTIAVHPLLLSVTCKIAVIRYKGRIAWSFRKYRISLAEWAFKSNESAKFMYFFGAFMKPLCPICARGLTYHSSPLQVTQSYYTIQVMLAVLSQKRIF